MKKLEILLIGFMMLMSCSKVDESPIIRDGSLFLFNGLGDVGTLSVIDSEGEISNDVMNVGKWPNHINEHAGVLYVVNSGNDNIQMIDASTNANLGSVELPDFSNPMRSVVCNGKVYITSTFGMGIDVYSIDKEELNTITIPEDMIPAANINGGTDAIYTDGSLVYIGVKNITYDQDWNAVYGMEHIIIIDSAFDDLVVAKEVGYNISDILIDHEGDLHVLCSGNRDDVNGLVKVYSNSKLTKETVDEIVLGSQPSSMILDSEGFIYVGVAGLNPDWSGFGGIMKYNSITDSVLYSSNNLLYNSVESGIMDLCVDGYGRLYAPLFDKNELVVFENDSIDTIMTTGNGPQGIVFLRDEE